MVGLTHGTSAVAAAEKSGEGADILLEGGSAGILFQKHLYPVPLLAGDDRLMGPLHYRPLAPVQLLRPAVHNLPGCAALLHVPDIHLIFQHPVNGSVGPVGSFPKPLSVVIALPVQLLVLAGTGDAFLVQQLGNSDFPVPLLVQIENALDHCGGAGVNQQLVVVLRVLPVAVGCKSSDELALPLLGLHGTFDLVGNIPGILLVKHILEGKQHVIRAIFTVNVVVDRQKAHSVLREPAFQVAA